MTTAIQRAAIRAPNRIVVDTPSKVNTNLMGAPKLHPYAEIGARIADLRRKLAVSRATKVTQSDVAQAVGAHLGTVTAWEIGKQRPEGEKLERLATFLRADPRYILMGDAIEPDVEPDIPPVEFLKPAARTWFHAKIGEWFAAGWRPEEVSEAARSLVSALDGGGAVRFGGPGRADELSEEEQLLALRGGAGHVERYLAPRWGRKTI